MYLASSMVNGLCREFRVTQSGVKILAPLTLKTWLSYLTSQPQLLIHQTAKNTAYPTKLLREFNEIIPVSPLVWYLLWQVLDLC